MVRHTETAKIQAMKAISKRSVLTYDELDHTLTEVRILKQFAKYEPNNPFVIRLNYAFMDKENIYFVMDFYPGTSWNCTRRKEVETDDDRRRFGYADGNRTIGPYKDKVLRSRHHPRTHRPVCPVIRPEDKADNQSPTRHHRPGSQTGKHPTQSRRPCRPCRFRTLETILVSWRAHSGYYTDIPRPTISSLLGWSGFGQCETEL